jgi:hypothetical protein
MPLNVMDKTLVNILYELRALDRHMRIKVQEQLSAIETSLTVRIEIYYTFYARSMNGLTMYTTPSMVFGGQESHHKQTVCYYR